MCDLHTYVTSSAKPTMFTPQLNLILLLHPAYRFTQWLSFPSVLNVNWSALLGDILPTLQSHN